MRWSSIFQQIYIYVEVEIKLGTCFKTYSIEKFYLMNNLPSLRALLGYPFFIRTSTGAILDARGGTFFIADFKETIPLLRMKAEHPFEMIFATFGLSSMPICFPLQPSLAE